MPVPASSLSVICDNIRDVVAMGIDATTSNITVTMGAPAALGTATEHQLNLFFYRFEPSGFEAGARPDLPWNLRMFCMITPFGIDETAGDGTTVSAGENDMRILGDVMRVLHETPILPTVSAAAGIDVRTRVVFMSTSDEQINQVWSTQGDTHFRPSAVYEMSLTPVVPDTLMPEPARVGAIGADVRGPEGRFATFTGVVSGPPVPPRRVNTDDPMWRPATALIWQDTLHRSLSFDIDSVGFAGFVPQVWLAGDPTVPCDLVWQVWRASGWEAAGAPVAATPATQDIEPAHIPSGLPGFPVAAPLPEALAPGVASLQLMLFAERSYTPMPGAAPVRLRSDPILITLWRDLP